MARSLRAYFTNRRGVEFSYTIDWETPLNIAVDITVFDPPELVWHDEWGQNITPQG